MPNPKQTPVRTPYDILAKLLLRELLEPVGTVELKAEAAATPRRIDLLFSRTVVAHFPPFFDALFVLEVGHPDDQRPHPPARHLRRLSRQEVPARRHRAEGQCGERQAGQYPCKDEAHCFSCGASG
jgi:hypothetical protein